MFTQRNNKAKCFQDCIVKNRKTNGLRFRCDIRWVRKGEGRRRGVGQWGRTHPGSGVGGWVVWETLVSKPQTFHLVLYPRVVKPDVKRQGSVTTGACVAEFGLVWTNGFKKAYGSRGSNSPPYRITNPPRLIFFETTCGIITTSAGQKSIAGPE